MGRSCVLVTYNKYVDTRLLSWYIGQYWNPFCISCEALQQGRDQDCEQGIRVGCKADELSGYGKESTMKQQEMISCTDQLHKGLMQLETWSRKRPSSWSHFILKVSQLLRGDRVEGFASSFKDQVVKQHQYDLSTPNGIKVIYVIASTE